jgi:hypothetical protein
MVKILTVICSSLILLGVADLLTTVVGVTGKGAIEVNPIFATLTQTNILAFMGLKILTVLFTGFMFLGAGRIAKASSNFIGNYFITSASTASCLIMTAVVANNVLVLLKIP